MKLFKISIPSESTLKYFTDKANKRDNKKATILIIKRIRQIITNMAKEGLNCYYKDIPAENEHSYETYVAFRWFRRYSKLNVKTENETAETHKGEKYISHMSIKIDW